MHNLCFGGTFNPIHNGHLTVARSVREQFGYNRVTLIPNQQSPVIKFGVAPAEDRLTMCQLAAYGEEGFVVSDTEINRPGPSYTYDTARQLQTDGHAVFWLVGGDKLTELPKWHKWESLKEVLTFVFVDRPGYNPVLDPATKWIRDRINYITVEAPLIDISASQVRERVGCGDSIRWLVPDAVEKYIRVKGLYR